MSKQPKDAQLVVDVRVVDVQPLALDSLQASRALSVSQRTLWSLTHPRGPIRVKKCGRLNLYPLQELQRFLADEGDAATN
jgi:hypothetical protein